MVTEIDNMFDEVLEPFGANAASFFLAASLYHAKKVSFERAAAMAGLSFNEFGRRLNEHFGAGFILADETVREDMRLAKKLVD
jgi:hypothetical protein